MGLWLVMALVLSDGAPRGSVDEFRALMGSVAAAWTARDTPRALACFTADALYMQPPDQQLYRGQAELERLFKGIKPGTVMGLHNVAFDPETQTGFAEFSFGRAGSGRAVHGVVVATLRDGRVASWREYFEEGPESFAAFVAIDGKEWRWTAADLPQE